ncbi:MAG: phosphatidylserine decarboxylase [Candidatus Heimdallarchaeota archaeon]
MRLAQGHRPITIPLEVVIVATFVFSVLLGHIYIQILLVLSLIAFIFVLVFFRDPKRSIPDTAGILAPADGKVFEINEQEGIFSVSIMMSLLDVHVNRMPLTGRILSIEKKSGSHFPMLPFSTKRSRKNARQIIKIEVEDYQIEMIQISGFLARRCVCYYEPGAVVPRGKRLGMVRFGSEVDLHFPSTRFHVIVQIGQRVRAGETMIAVEREKLSK